MITISLHPATSSFGPLKTHNVTTVEENIYIRSVCEGVTDARLYNMKLTEALHSVYAIYLGLPIFNYDAKFLTARHSM